ncbi:ranBP2-like and GRIP domain-containing protein 3 (plasmid) [Acetobacter orientalis]|uniref:RanBP2-like and GRIP domain-containing protein 3 n=1 Tax=Acetobacter orientalis TaxID=146474 RepID=A0A2Z5ZMN6_9PROT|nr:ranBP2-like and GRIP domain-containing protein 3 [Acetobacter orientalis]
MSNNLTTAETKSIGELLRKGMPAHSAWLQMLWEKLNHDLFSGKLTIPNEIDWVPGLPAEARYYSERNIIVLDASRYTIELVMKQHNIGRTTPNDDEWNQFFEVLYLLIHEMVHQYIAQQGSGSTKHDAEFLMSQIRCLERQNSISRIVMSTTPLIGR